MGTDPNFDYLAPVHYKPRKPRRRQRGFTIVPRINKLENRLEFGISICSPVDKFDENGGYHRAMSYLLNNRPIISEPIPDKNREAAIHVLTRDLEERIRKFPYHYTTLISAVNGLVREDREIQSIREVRMRGEAFIHSMMESAEEAKPTLRPKTKAKPKSKPKAKPKAKPKTKKK